MQGCELCGFSICGERGVTILRTTGVRLCIDICDEMIFDGVKVVADGTGSTILVIRSNWSSSRFEVPSRSIRAQLTLTFSSLIASRTASSACSASTSEASGFAKDVCEHTLALEALVVVGVGVVSVSVRLVGLSRSSLGLSGWFGNSCFGCSPSDLVALAAKLVKGVDLLVDVTSSKTGFDDVVGYDAC